jgi:hypothetical protein
LGDERHLDQVDGASLSSFVPTIVQAMVAMVV